MSDAEAALQQMQFEAQRAQMRQAAAAAAAAPPADATQAPPAASAAADTGAAPMNVDTETKASAPAPAAAAPETKAAAPAPAAPAPEAKAAAPAAVPETKAEPSIPFEKLKASIATMKSLLSADGDPSLDFVCKRATEGDVEAFDHLMQMLKRSKRAKNDHVATAASADPVPAPQQQPPPRQVNMSGWMPGHTPTSATSAGQASRPLDTTAPSARVRQVVMCMADEAMTTASSLKDFEKRAVNWNAGPAGESLRKAFQDALDQWTMVQTRMTHGNRVLAAANRNSTAILASADECVYGTPYEKYGIPATLPEVAGQLVMSWHEGPDRARALALYNENRRQRQKQALMHGRGDDSVY